MPPRSSLFRSVRWPAVAIAVAVVLSFGGGAVAKATYDARNAHKVDGKHAVGAHSTIENRKGKLVATDTKTGRLPSDIVTNVGNSARLGGYTHKQISAIAIPPQGIGVNGVATVGLNGAQLTPTGTGAIRFGFVVPPAHNPADTLWVDLVYGEESAAACAWAIATSGLTGTSTPAADDLSNGAWSFPGAAGYQGTIKVPAGAGAVHTARFSWPFDDDPGMFIQFGLERSGDSAADTCDYVTIYAIQLRY